jgi:hypothetical protein
VKRMPSPRFKVYGGVILVVRVVFILLRVI